MAMETMTEKIITVRLPEELHAKLVRLAEADIRSLHSYILKALADKVAAEETKR